jgi:hypothetical protein
VEACWSIDVNKLHREGGLRPGWSAWQWRRGQEKTASINWRAEGDRLHLVYRVGIGGDWEDVAQTVPIVRVPCTFGGVRPYFICPGVVNGIPCGRRVAKLYAAGRYFLCRYCYRLPYASQSEEIWERMRRRANKIWQRLGAEPGVLAPMPRKGMSWSTYERLLAKAAHAEELADKALVSRLQQFNAQIEIATRKKNSRGSA